VSDIGLPVQDRETVWSVMRLMEQDIMAGRVTQKCAVETKAVGSAAEGRVKQRQQRSPDDKFLPGVGEMTNSKQDAPTLITLLIRTSFW
jgi:hypothetical protein